MRYLIKGVGIPKEDKLWYADILVEDGVIADISDKIEVEAEIIDAKGMIAMPGLCELHAYLREPGYEYKETIKSATYAALHGGYTTVVAMPETLPVIDSVEMVDSFMMKAMRDSAVEICPAVSITMGLGGEYITNLREIKEKGIMCCCDGKRSIANANLARKAMLSARDVDIPLFVYCEDMNIRGMGLINESESAKKLGLLPVSRLAENLLVSRDCIMALETGARIHIMNISTKESVEIIRFYKDKGAYITCDVSINNLLMSDGDIVEDLGIYSFNPPLRDMSDIKALIEGLKDGTIDHISCDHTPNHPSEKLCSIKTACAGVAGFETALALCYTYLVEKKKLTLSELVKKLSDNPRRILGLPEYKLEKGAKATFLLADITRTVSAESLNQFTFSKITPYQGAQVKGDVSYVFVDGNINLKK